MKLCVMGLGYIGLPTAVMFAEHGLQVHGVDINPEVTKLLNEHKAHIEEPGLQDKLVKVMEEGKLTVSTSPIKADAYILAVPTPLTSDKKADLNYVYSACSLILPYLKKGSLVILESTVPPGTVEDFLIPILEKSTFKIGDEIFVSHSPERVLPGKLFEELINNDRIVGGINEESCLRTVFLYKHFVRGNIYMTDAKTAEMVKLIENTYRDVNIALANELAMIGEKYGINMLEAITLANYHPRVNIHAPGPGVGGHCIAVDPWFIIEQAPDETKLITAAREINESTPDRIVNLIESAIQGISSPIITLLGLAYKGNIDDLRESPALVIYDKLRKKGYDIKWHDPYVQKELEGKCETIEEAVYTSDCAVILTDHNQYKTQEFKILSDLFRNRILIDTRNIVNKNSMIAAGYKCLQIGTPLR
ncbi:nucleotide sugar dehydrogenase [Cytobacillus firmus]|uniref:Nucleotide sugar dehydrogenase n=1 Tax=Cytobacillus firmus DS1 TaxID=1307436 RepID=W7KNG9_CYTFI|nr:nucleotide sugar dehydrogenase [Cytobacillus firmus]EWG09050.1 nucleotide sugar dehydrogenase [Cytobacillus firmus DS1]